MTRTIEEYRRALALHKEGNSQDKIAKILKIPRRTIGDWVTNKINLETSTQIVSLNPQDYLATEESKNAYSYLLGSYLGDGYIARHPRAYRIRIYCDSAQPYVIEANKTALNQLLPNNLVSVYKRKHTNCSEVSSYSTALLELFPQAKQVGPKHSKDVSLVSWQKEIIKCREHLVLKGLFHSDGSFYIADKKYYRYQFTNTSEDIINLIIYCLNKLNIKWYKTLKKSVTQKICANKKESTSVVGYNIHISRKEEVKKLYKFVGTKYNETIEALENE